MTNTNAHYQCSDCARCICRCACGRDLNQEGADAEYASWQRGEWKPDAGAPDGMILYQSGAGDTYALCGAACKLLLDEWLTNPDAIGPTCRERGAEVPYACFFCLESIDPSTWGTPIERTVA